MTILSVVTINYNNGKGLLRTIESVRKQINNGATIEYIIIDGKSSDDSLEIIESNKDIINILIHEVDNGIYSAMNKGLKVASGDSILFLNSGDIFYNDFNLKNFQSFYDLKNNNVFTRTIQVYEDIGFIRPKKNKKKTIYSDYGHQGAFIKKENYKKTVFEEDKKIISDSIWMHNVWTFGPNLISDDISAVFELGGVSNNYIYKNVKKLLKEKKSIQEKGKVIIKFILQSVLSKKMFYRLIYSNKYDYITYSK